MLVGVAAVLQRHPYVSVLVDGHSNGKKNTPFLQKLSEKRGAWQSISFVSCAHATNPDMRYGVVAISVKSELVAQGVRPDHIKVKGSGADGKCCAVRNCAGTAGFADCLARSAVLCTGRGGHVFITVSKIDTEAAGIARGLATPERSFADHLDDITMSPEQQAKVRAY